VDASDYVDPPDEPGPPARQVRRAAAVADCVRQRLNPVEVSFSERGRGQLVVVLACEPSEAVGAPMMLHAPPEDDLTWLKQRAAALGAAARRDVVGLFRQRLQPERDGQPARPAPQYPRVPAGPHRQAHRPSPRAVRGRRAAAGGTADHREPANRLAAAYSTNA